MLLIVMGQCEDDLVQLAAFQEEIKRTFIDDKPRHLTAGSGSAFRVIEQEDYMKMGVSEIQEVLRQQCIVVPGSGAPNVKFDEQGLGRLDCLSNVVTMRGKHGRCS